jgi:hypothetical protein
MLGKGDKKPGTQTANHQHTQNKPKCDQRYHANRMHVEIMGHKISLQILMWAGALDRCVSQLTQWVKMPAVKARAVRREAEEDWGK